MEKCTRLGSVQFYKRHTGVRWVYGMAHGTLYGSRSYVDVANAHTLAARIQYTDGKPI